MKDVLSFRVARVVVLAALSVFVLFPIYIAFVTAATRFEDFSNTFQWWPQHPDLGAFVDVWHETPLAKYFMNSIIVTVATVAIAIPIALAAAYGVSRYRFPGRQAFLAVILSTQMFPGIFFLIPLFLLLVKLQGLVGVQLVGSRPALVLVYLSFALPLCIWVLAGYFASIPKDIEEAGMIDGLSDVGAFVRLVLPSNLGAVVAVAVFATVLSWSEVLFASVLTTNATQTLAIGLSAIVAQPTSPIHWNNIMAASILASLPIVVAFSLVQKRFVQGLSSGAVKG
ncbi:carbohydrate ABC transporter permease [Microlunatus antarcticus]|uniref:Multiple sugar transport system permease protein n=1 Tax=Microlunatus antarcticus TaxID=53388 RepID=A0A7W5JUG9_9ACTN|nr:carbohydrate ABC transporter permease [Microlunatus antarcticus]MBB3326440.1 multiple sugar transport system permease protein [Microlunatus antarcticus]